MIGPTAASTADMAFNFSTELSNFTHNTTYITPSTYARNHYTLPYDYYKVSGGRCHLEGSTLINFHVVVLVLLAIIATVENLLVVILICKRSELRTPLLMMYGILAAVDLLTGAVVIPIEVFFTLSNLPRFLSDCLYYAVNLLSYATVVMISIDRFCHVYFLERYNMTIKKLGIAVFLSWFLFVVVLILKALLVWWVRYIINVFFIASLVIMIVTWVAIILILRRRKHLDNNDASVKILLKKQKRAMKTTLIIFVTFTVMSVPTALSLILYKLFNFYSRYLCAIVLVPLLANSAVNPLIYCWRIPEMREHMLKFLRFSSGAGDMDSNESHDILTDQETHNI